MNNELAKMLSPEAKDFLLNPTKANFETYEKMYIKYLKQEKIDALQQATSKKTDNTPTEKKTNTATKTDNKFLGGSGKATTTNLPKKEDETKGWCSWCWCCPGTNKETE